MSAFIIAEIGSNWKTRDDIFMSINQAKNCGADAVKFQLYTHRELYGFDGEMAGVLEPLWLASMRDKAESVGIEFMCTAFSPEGYDKVNPFVQRHKIASSELTHKRILEKVRSFGKPVILSTAAAMPDEIEESLKILEGVPVTLMYCVGAYPARVINLELLPMLALFGKPIGYSDHSTDALVIPQAAVDRGATVIEKHVSFVDADSPDKPHSLNAYEFELMVKKLKNYPISALGPTKEERPMVLRHKRRLKAIKDIEPGDVLKEDVNFGIYRSKLDDAEAMHGFSIDQVAGRAATQAIKCGEGISPKIL